MISQTIIFIIGLSVSLAYPTGDLMTYEKLEDTNGYQYYLVPVNFGDLLRLKRQTSSVTATDSGFGVSHRQPFYNHNDHQLGATGFYNKQYGGPSTTGGSLDYLHKPSGSGLSLGGSHNSHGLGNDLTATGRYKFFESRDGRTSATASGHVNQHFGGLEGTNGRSYGAGLTLEHKF